MTWRALVAEVRSQKREMLAGALAHGRVLALARSEVRLGYGAREGMYRRQVERQQAEVEAILSRILGAPTRLSLEEASGTEAVISIAQEDDARAAARERRIVQESREHPAVLAALRILAGEVEHVRVLEEEADEPMGAPGESSEAEDEDG